MFRSKKAKAIVGMVAIGIIAIASIAATNLQATPPAPTGVTATATSEGIRVRWDDDNAAVHRVGWAHNADARAANAAGDWLEAFHFADTKRNTDYTIKYLPPDTQYWVIVGGANFRFAGSSWSEWAQITTPTSDTPQDCVSQGTCLPLRQVGRFTGVGQNTAHVITLAAAVYRMTLSGPGSISADLHSLSEGRDIYYFDYLSSDETVTSEIVTVDTEDAGNYLLEIDADAGANWVFEIVRVN